MKKIVSLLSIFLFFLTLDSFCFEEQEIVIVVPSYNTLEWAAKNIISILHQNYKNYTVLYYVDCSNDGSYEYIKQLLRVYDEEHHVLLIYNEVRKGALANHWDAVHRCRDDVIIVHCDGDDWFAHPDVLKRVNEAYLDPNVWVTYGQYMEYPANTLGHCKPVGHNIIDENLWRYLALPLPTTHLRTFRACLFKQIALQDLIDQGAFLPTAGDIAFFWPILEMAGKHVKFINEILYVYNTANDLNDYKVRFQQQMHYFNMIRNKKRYTPLDCLPIRKNEREIKKADVLVFSYNRPMQLYCFLESLFMYVKNLGMVNVLYRSDNQEYADAYAQVQQKFPLVVFVKQSCENPQQDFKKNTVDSIEHGDNDYIIFAVDDIIVKGFCDLHDCIAALEKTHAYGFYLRLGMNITHCYMANRSHALPNLVPIGNQMYAWSFKDGGYDWRYPNSVDMTLYKKSDIIEAFKNLDYSNPSNLEGNWFIPEYVDYEKIGLCYQSSKIVNIPLNVVQTEHNNTHMNLETVYLLELFNQGLKIDSAPLYMIKNRSPHMEYYPSFIVR